jgi:hypothetical protein
VGKLERFPANGRGLSRTGEHKSISYRNYDKTKLIDLELKEGSFMFRSVTNGTRSYLSLSHEPDYNVIMTNIGHAALTNINDTIVKKCPVSMGTNSNPVKDSKAEESPVIQSTVAKDTPTSEPDQESLDAGSENLKACGTT